MVAQVLSALPTSLMVRVLASLPESRRDKLANLFDQSDSAWQLNLAHPESSVGRLMEPIEVQLRVTQTVAEAIEAIRPFANSMQMVYAYVLNDEDRLVGVTAMRDLLFAESGDLVENIMVAEPFYFHEDTDLKEATRAVLQRHYPAYPVCDDERRLVGQLRGYALFEQQTVELTAQAGRMVGIEKEEHLSTPWLTCLKMRHPWLQLNLLTAFVAGAVVGLFEDTIAQVVALAAFLPVLAGQAGNTGCQSLAVTLRAITLNELKPGMEKAAVRKESILGLINGLMVGVTAGVAMLAYAMVNGSLEPLMLAVIVLVAMAGSCLAAGISGVLVPLALRRFGADPATASTIFLTTATDVFSMGGLLALATVLIL